MFSHQLVTTTCPLQILLPSHGAKRSSRVQRCNVRKQQQPLDVSKLEVGDSVRGSTAGKTARGVADSRWSWCELTACKCNACAILQNECNDTVCVMQHSLIIFCSCLF